MTSIAAEVPAVTALRRILRSKEVNLFELAEAAKTTRGQLIDFADEAATLSPDQLEAVVRALWHGGVEIRGDRLYVKRTFEPIALTASTVASRMAVSG